MRFDDDLCQWWVVNAAGHRRMLEAAGFEVVDSHGPYCEPFGKGHPPRSTGLRALARSLSRRALTGGQGRPRSALLARPRL